MIDQESTKEKMGQEIEDFNNRLRQQIEETHSFKKRLADAKAALQICRLAKSHEIKQLRDELDKCKDSVSNMRLARDKLESQVDERREEVANLK